MDTGLSSPAVAIDDHQMDLEIFIDEVKLRQVWRWLDVIDEGEPPEEQPAFNDFGEPHNWVQIQECKPEVSKQNPQQLLPEQAKNDHALKQATQIPSLAPKPTQHYGQVQILKRSPTSGLSSEQYTNLVKNMQAASGDRHYKAPVTFLDPGQSQRGKTFAERAKDLASPAALWPRSTAEPAINHHFGIDCTSKKVSQLVRRIRADSKSAAQTFVKHTK